MDTFPALTDVSFDVKRGEFFGIVGRNGSGKSTLLKCMAGIYKADTGQVLVAGRVSTFIELGVGFNPDLAARDNAILNAIMLGLTRARGARALRPHHRLRRPARVRGAEAQELLVGHARAARVLGDDPGRRRRAADRRGARRGRRRLPAEVLRRVQPPARRGPHDPARHARHDDGLALLRARDAAREGRGGRHRRPRRGRGRVLRDELRARRRASPRRSTARTRATARSRSPTPGSRTARATASTCSRRGAARRSWPSCASSSRTRTPSSRSRSAPTTATSRSRPRRCGRRSTPARSRPASTSASASRSTTTSRPAAITRRRGSRAAARARTCTCASGTWPPSW